MTGIRLTVRGDGGGVLWRGRTAATPADGDSMLIPDDAEDLRLYRLEARCWSLNGGMLEVTFIARPQTGHNREQVL